MACAVERLLGDRISAGLIVVKYGHGEELEQVEVVEAGHPIPDEQGQQGAQRIVDLLTAADENTLVISLFSGGGSALLTMPAVGLTLADLRRVNELLQAAGADIGETNAVRKHLSAVKGGQLARAAQPAAVIDLLVSDVIGDPLDVIASGPMVGDSSTFADAYETLRRHQVWDRVPAAVRRHIEAGRDGNHPENPPPGDPALGHCAHAIVASNRAALTACAAEARTRGYRAWVLTSTVEGESREVARVLAAVAREVRQSGNPVEAPACLISGGETTVTVRGDGRGGRNQELALAAARALAGVDGVVLLAAGTDGSDGPTDAAGGFAFGDSEARMIFAGLSARERLEANDSYTALAAVGDLLVTGPTGTNVMDIQVVLVSDGGGQR
jgi:hydroxypyruvate reductase